jgi:carbamoyl-phosphate synthase large subunit
MVKVLFSSAGRRVALINTFRNAARELGNDITVIAVDMDPSWSPACQVADIACRVGRCTSDEFIPQMLDICRKYQVNLIVPTIDTELMFFAENRDLFVETGTEIHIGDSEFVAIARDKAATAKALAGSHISVPESWKIQDILNNFRQIPFPVLIKPRDGSCSKGISVLSCIEELYNKIRNPEDWLAQEICTGQEYTINCFYDRSGKCVSCVPHFRRFVRDGEVCFAQTERVPEFTEIAHKLSGIFKGIRGCICFQGFKQEDGSVRVFEINARFGGGYPICDKAGGTFARWLLQEVLGQPPDYHDNWREGVRMLRYDEAVFTEG